MLSSHYADKFLAGQKRTNELLTEQIKVAKENVNGGKDSSDANDISAINDSSAPNDSSATNDSSAATNDNSSPQPATTFRNNNNNSSISASNGPVGCIREQTLSQAIAIWLRSFCSPSVD
ncbi:hypothetical protein VE00_08917 [Pseudogymnoascus sp. WSF 3629]|nr:hypothetical protein VE00_08917 [Pseudogymnoascus sp. WSF 3629]